MPIIDQDGYFGGDRFDLISDSARAIWPSFFLASNTLARLELNYFKVMARAFSRWKKKPAEKQFWDWITEYREAFLLFVYQAPDGQLWGQWDTSEKFLPRHKLSADKLSPAPTVKDFLGWKNAYIAVKASKSNAPANFVNLAPISAEFRTELRGVGVGVGVVVGIDKNNTVAADAADFVSWFNSEFWQAYPRKVAKSEAFRAARKVGKSESDRAEIMDGLNTQLPSMRAKDPQYIPHPATWLNQNRWKDQPEQKQAESCGAPANGRTPREQARFDELMRD